MTLHDFIFTKKWPGKYYRHIAFWVAQFFLWTFWTGSFFYDFIKGINWQLRFQSFYILHIIYTYLVVYFFYAEFLAKKRILKFGISICILTVLSYLLFVSNLLWREDILINFTKDKNLLLYTWYFSMNFISMGPPVVCAMFLTFKMLKNFHLKMEEKISLTKENANAELQILKAQVHPHFLFNTLNNIYSFALTKSTQAPKLVMNLSNTIRYMVYDCDAPLVPLEKEIKMLNDYIELEKVRYGKRLKTEILIQGDYQNKLIAPLLLIPFVENSFKHGTSKMLWHPWMKLQMIVKENTLWFALSNSKPTEAVTANGKKGIGLKNVQKRLALLYPAKHQLTISSTEDEYAIKMRIPLTAIVQEQSGKFVTHQTVLYD